MLDVVIYEVMVHFNSIKVQLEQLPMFNLISSDVFQFHKGTIRTAYYSGKRNIYHNFNSIKVQLELEVNGKEMTVYEFQFHKGTIRTPDTTIDSFFVPISIP